MPNNTHALSIRAMQRDNALRQRQGLQQDPQHYGWRPQTRRDCAAVPRPCPYVGCRYNLFLNVSENGSVKFPHGPDFDAMRNLPTNCALDVAEEGGIESADIGLFLAVTPNMVRREKQIALEKLAGFSGLGE